LNYVNTRQGPQNFIRDTSLEDRFEEYPKLRELITLKDAMIKERGTPAMSQKCDLKNFDFKSLGTKFDVILIDPPWEEYSKRCLGIAGISDIECWTLDEIGALLIDELSESPSFVFLWVGSSGGTDIGRKLLKKWGFRRCEDICWIKTNKSATNEPQPHDKKSVFIHTKEHCLVGIKGTVRRNQDGHIIHANIDTDVIISEEPPFGSMQKPEELYHIIEHFSLGRRRIELFGDDHNIRDGWVTLGRNLSISNYNTAAYTAYFAPPDSYLLGTTQEIESLRPKSPPHSRNKNGAPPSNLKGLPSNFATQDSFLPPFKAQ